MKGSWKSRKMDGLEKKNVEDVTKWVLGLVFSGALSGVANWWMKRKQERAIIRAQAIPAEDVNPSAPYPPVVALPPASGGEDDLRMLVEKIKAQLELSQERGDE